MDLTLPTPELLERFAARRREELRPRVRMGLLLGALLFAAFALWETLLDPSRLAESLPLRAASFLALCGLWALTFQSTVARRPYLVLLVGVVVATFGVIALMDVIPHGLVYGIGSLLLVEGVITSVSPPTRVAAGAFALLLFVATFALALSAAPLHVHLSVWMLVGGGAVSATVLCRMSSRASLRAFRLESTLEHLASTDPLTGALNRHAFDRRARVELSRAERHRVPVSLLILDIDHFKRVNDTFGHPAGDAAIRTLAETIRGLLRGSDLFARLGGEEFAVLAPHTDSAAAAALAERLRALVASQEVHSSAGTFGFTISVGVAAAQGPSATLESLVSDADRALYAAKNGGRNRVAAGPLRRVA